MAKNRSNPLIEALEDLLDKERHLLLAGHVDEVGRLAQQKTRLLGEPDIWRTGNDTLRRIRTKALRNGTLLEAALLGVKAAAARIDRLRKGAGALNTYGRDGQRQILDQREHAPDLERKV